jgi:predicted metalloprotease
MVSFWNDAMRWDESHESPDLIDRRGEGGRMGGGGGLIDLFLWLLPWLIRSPFGWLVILGFLAFAVFQGVTRGLLSGGVQGVATGSHVTDPQAHFVAFVLDDVQSTWQGEFARRGLPYRHAKLVLFTDATRTGCGYGDAATGPFYCPEDERVYIDLGFYEELKHRLGAGGQFAQAYVIAHEMGHHVQNLLGTSDRVGGHAEGASGGSVRLELQADCYAGIWAHDTGQRNLLEQGDIESALNAASAIGDDRLQRQATGRVRPDSFTHGTSAQRVRWFTRGYETGKMESCDTFGAKGL